MKTCENDKCGVKYVGNGYGKGRFCSLKCYSSVRNREQYRKIKAGEDVQWKTPRTCKCGEEFIPKMLHQYKCSTCANRRGTHKFSQCEYLPIANYLEDVLPRAIVNFRLERGYYPYGMTGR